MMWMSIPKPSIFFLLWISMQLRATLEFASGHNKKFSTVDFWNREILPELAFESPKLVG